MTLPGDRFDYSAIVDREPLKLPNDARIAIWTIVNVEDWDIRGPMPRTVLPAPGGANVIPDVSNWAWYEYGMRVVSMSSDYVRLSGQGKCPSRPLSYHRTVIRGT